MDASPNYDRLAELFQHLITVSLAGIGFLFTVQSLPSFPESEYSAAAVIFFGATVVSGLFGYVSITSLSLGERPKRDISVLRPRFWFYCTWIAFCLGVVWSMAVVLGWK